MSRSATSLFSKPHEQRSAFFFLAGIGVLVAVLTFAIPFAHAAAGDNAFIALAVVAGFLAIAATHFAERAAARRALWLILGLAVVFRLFAISFEPFLSSDIYRYIWDGKVQAAGINPYRYVPADPLLAQLRDTAIFPNINRADSAVTIYPPVAQAFFFLVTRFGTSTTTMRIALLLCEAGSVAIMLGLLRRLGKPVTRVVAYAWHPLPIWEIANNGHVDALAVLLMLLGLWALIGGRLVAGAVSVAAGALAKPFVAPVLAVMWRPWNWKVALAAVATVALCYAPYLSVGWGVLGFLTQGYFREEGLSSGQGLWLLSLWRLLFGTHQGDLAVYIAVAAAVLMIAVLWVWRQPARTAEGDLSAINMLLLLVLLLLSPNYPWYFLVITPFVALSGNRPTWAASIGALLLANEVEWDFLIPPMITKSVLFGSISLALLWSAASARQLGHQVEAE